MTVNIDYITLTEQVIQVAENAGKILTTHFNTPHTLTTKGTLVLANDFATEADFQAQNYILQALRTLRPEDKLIAEEQDQTEHTLNHSLAHQLVWHVDPLDGTVNYAHGFEHYAVSIAAVDALTGEPIIGVVHAPSINRTYYSDNQKSYMKNTLTGEITTLTVSVSPTAPILSAGIPYTTPQQKQLFTVLPQIMEHYGSSRDLGACALNLCFLAEGRFDATLEVTVKTWDYMAGFAIIRNAGMFATAIPNDLFGGYTVYSAKTLHEHDSLGEYMKIVAGYPLP